MAVDGTTLRMVIYDLLRDFKQVYSQASVSEYQMAYWVIFHADRLRKLHIQKIDSTQYLTVYQDVAVSIDSKGNKYIELPASIYDFDMDRGINFISYYQQGIDDSPMFSQITFGRTTPAKAKRLSYRDEETPGPSNPYFYRVGDNIYFLGVENVALPKVDIGIMQTLNPADTSMDIDQPFDFPQDLIPVLKRQVLDLGLWALNVPRDLKNDGADAQAPIQQKKFVSVNDFSNDVNSQES